VYIANVLKCRPPGNRDPEPDEIAACEGHLFAQVELIRPRVICTLGNFATKLLSGQPHGITRVHGRAQPRRIAGVDLVLYPIFHPAAALYTPAMMDTLRDDFGKLPELLSTEPVAAASPAPPAAPVAPPEPVAEPEPEYAQLGLF
jgi:DNA polymerase